MQDFNSNQIIGDLSSSMHACVICLGESTRPLNIIV